MHGALQNELVTALEWYVDQGVTDLVGDTVVDRTHVEDAPVMDAVRVTPQHHHKSEPDISAVQHAKIAQEQNPASPAFLGKSDAYDEAVKLAQAAGTLEELRQAIAEFDGISIKKTASNLVFADGNPQADIMLVGEAPGADEDRQGKPFVGVSGQLLDKMLSCIDITRDHENAQNSIYISNILNWRPPGNRTPSPAEIEVSLPFIERHIQLASPKILILCGGVAAKALLSSSKSISRLRKSWHEYSSVTDPIAQNAASIPAIATYHPSYLLRTPAQKKAAWADLIEIQNKRTTA